ncbi:MAG: hypothetical protein BAJALOKI3v1_50075 [Promethearchaeota archaeon]|nr:MAG: hypothetical protein BAJALOKI3v1_50075 [Candidatus Lokiarchaeota archaeon]
MPKIAFGMIVFNGNYVLKECLESIYPFANQILISEGPVSYWQRKGYTTSVDGTNDVLHEFYDPDNKIKIVHGQFEEKDEQCNAYMKHLKDENEFIWNIDSDEVFKNTDMWTICKLLDEYPITSVGFKSYSFYGGFDNYLTGFEEAHEFMRIRRIYPGSYWATHRPPTIAHKIKNVQPERHLSSDVLWKQCHIRMYHYSYVFPRQVKEKVSYYKSDISKDNCIDNYFENIYLPWVNGTDQDKKNIEEQWEGVHEFKPKYRGECYTAKFDNTHPDVIVKNIEDLKTKYENQLNDLAKRN